MVTLKDIAKELELDVSVVSRALNPNPDRHAIVASRTKRLVFEKARQLGYQRNRQAEFLKRGCQATIGVFIPDVPNRLVADLMIGISLEAAREGFPLNFYFGSEWKEYQKFLKSHDDVSLSGIITYPFNNSIAGRISRSLCHYRERGGNIVVLNADRDYEGIPVLRIDDAHGSELAAEHLLDCGCRSFLTDNSFPVRNRAFSAWLEKAGKKVSRFKAEQLPAVFERMLSSACRPVGIFASSDMLAVEISAMATVCGLKLGEELKLVGFDDLFMTGQLSPSLTTVRQPFRVLGERAVRTLVKMIYRHSVRSQRLKPVLMVRESTMGRSSDS